MSHGFDHAFAVGYNAMLILSARKNAPSKRSFDIIFLSCLFHDVCDHKYKYLTISKEERNTFLLATQGKINGQLIIDICDNMSWSAEVRGENKPLKAEHDWMRRIVQDADRLEALGETGLQRCIDVVKERNGKVPDDVCKHIEEKLMKLEFYTESAKELAIPKTKVVYDYYVKHRPQPEPVSLKTSKQTAPLHPFEVDIIVYHKGCIDGVTAAAMAYEFDYMVGRYVYMPMHAGDLHPDLKTTHFKKILFLDVCPTFEQFNDLIGRDNFVFVIDHHPAAEKLMNEVANPTNHVLYNNEKSGALLALEYFGTFPNYATIMNTVRVNLVTGSKDRSNYEVNMNTNRLLKIKEFVGYVSDNDLGKFDLLCTRDFARGIMKKVNAFGDDSDSEKVMYVWRQLEMSWYFIEQGILSTAEDLSYINDILSKAEIRFIGGISYVLAQAPTFRLCSEIGSKILETSPSVSFSLLVYQGKNGVGEAVNKVSARSRPGVNVNEVARLFKGDGHPQAAGFTIESIPRMISHIGSHFVSIADKVFPETKKVEVTEQPEVMEETKADHPSEVESNDKVSN